ncbi:hypothetical protein CNR22_01140 [Sphingobacteriaceae bacterium]|nr:hypothetical protein CNR22_01140 [Sphingobacteriaceae bacterium]
MKKNIFPAFCLSLCLVASTISATSVIVTSKSSVVRPNDERRIIKMSELPQAVKTALEADAYKEWKVKEIKEIKLAGAVNRPDLATQYEVKLTKGKESKTVRFLEDGRVEN